MFVVIFVALAGPVATMAEIPLKLVPAYSPEAQAVREATTLRREGDQLHEQGRAEEAREAWERAVEAYRRAGYPLGEAEVLSQIALSYQSKIMVAPESMIHMFDATARGAAVLAEFLDGLAQEAGDRSSISDVEGMALLRQASDLARRDCARALPLFEAAAQRYSAVDSGTGELRALAGRLRCLEVNGEDPISAMNFLTSMQEFSKIAEGLQGRYKAGPAMRYLKAAENVELGKWKEAETLLRAVLLEFEVAGDIDGINRTALDLGYLLIQQGKLQEAELNLKRAREGFGSRNDAASQRNLTASERNLTILDSGAAQLSPGSPDPPPLPELRAIDIIASADEPPLSEPAGMSSRARARREAVFLLGQGDRLAKAGRVAEARKKWQSSAEAYLQAEEIWDLSQPYFRLGDSYSLGSVTDESKRWLFLDYYDKALSVLLQALGKPMRKELPQSVEVLDKADDFLSQAIRLIGARGCAQAMPLVAQARGLYQQAGFALGEIRSQFLEARCRALSDDFTGAFGVVLEVLPRFHSLSLDTPGSELRNQADELLDTGEWQKARDAYQELLCRSERDRDVRGLALAMLGLGRVQVLLGNPSDAEALLQRALVFLPLVDEELDESREAAALEDLGDVFFSNGHLEDGIAALRKAQKAFATAGRPEREVKSLNRLSRGLSESGEYAAALTVLTEAEVLLRYLPDSPEAEADLTTTRAFIEFQQGKFQNALSSLFKAQDLFGRAGSAKKQSGVLLLIGGLDEFLGREEEAATAYQTISDLTGGSSTGALSQIVMLAQIANLVQHDRTEEAVELGRQFLSHVVGKEDTTIETMVHALLAFSYLKLDRREEARKQLDAIPPAILEDLQDRRLAGARGSLTTLTQAFARTAEKLYALKESAEQLQGVPLNDPRVSLLLDDFATSLAGDSEAIESSIESFAPNGMVLNGFRLMEGLARRDPERSRENMDQALAFIDHWAAGLTLGELKGPFLNQFQELYSRAVELNQSTGHPEEAFRYAEEARARAFVDQIGNQRIDARRGADPKLLREERQLRLQLNKFRRDVQAEQQKDLQLQNTERLENLQQSAEKAASNWEGLSLRLKATNPEYAALVGVAPVSLSELQQQVLDGKTSLVEYFISPAEGDGVLAWVIDRNRLVMIPLNVSAGNLKERVTLFRKLIESNQPVQPLATELYRDLFAPLAPHVRHRNLVIVPHNSLHFLPFAALWDGKRYLGDSFALSYSPSATALKLARGREVPVVGSILAVGNPDGSLEHAATEAKSVARQYGSEPLLGPAASEGAVVSQANRAGILHLAAHAVLNPINPLFTRIELAPDEGHDGYLEMHEVFGLDLSKTGLVVLSACRTQLGRLSAGDEIEGLTRAFLYAGTPAVVSSLWDVQDESTSVLMDRFYSHLRKGKGRAEALRRAQIETRQRYPHPFHWAAFVLTGDGR